MTPEAKPICLPTGTTNQLDIDLVVTLLLAMGFTMVVVALLVFAFLKSPSKVEEPASGTGCTYMRLGDNV